MGVYDLGLTDEQFLEITPAQFNALIKRRNLEKQELDYRAGIVASNIVRVWAKEEDQGKYGPEAFFPSLKAEKEQDWRSTPEGMLRYLQTMYPPRE